MNGSEDFAWLFDKYNRRFTDYAASYVGKDNAQDMVMDAFVYYWERRDELEHANPPAYVLNTVRHRCLNHLRAKKVRETAARKLSDHACRILQLKISSLEALDPDEIFPENVQGELYRAIDSLPERTREVLLLIRVHGYTYREAADKLRITEKMVEADLKKAMRLLRGMLKSVTAFFIISL